METTTEVTPQPNEPLVEYVPCVLHDALMAQWYNVMLQRDELGKLFIEKSHSLSGFYDAIRRPTQTLFYVGAEGVWFVAMLTPHYAGASFDMWVHPGRRKSKAWVRAMCAALEVGFERYPVLVGLTAQENLLDDHVRMGYVVVGEVPKLWNGESPLWLMHITKESYEARKTRVRRAS